MAAGAAVARWMADVDDLFGMNVRSGKRSGTPVRDEREVTASGRVLRSACSGVQYANTWRT